MIRIFCTPLSLLQRFLAMQSSSRCLFLGPYHSLWILTRVSLGTVFKNSGQLVSFEVGPGGRPAFSVGGDSGSCSFHFSYHGDRDSGVLDPVGKSLILLFPAAYEEAPRSDEAERIHVQRRADTPGKRVNGDALQVNADTIAASEGELPGSGYAPNQHPRGTACCSL